MRTLYDIIYDETKVRYLKWKASLHTITYLSKMDFMKTIHDDIEWIVFSMWILIRANHKRPNERIDKFKERFNEAIRIVHNMKLGKDNSLNRRIDVLKEWLDEHDINKEFGIRNPYALNRVEEEGIDSKSEFFKELENDCIENIDAIINAMASGNLKYVNEI